MRRRRSISLCSHMAAAGVLAVLDLHQRLRRRVSRNFLRVTASILCSILVAIILSSLLALVQITYNVKSLLEDSMVGLEASVDMRAAVRETQLDLLRLRLNPGRKLPWEQIETFHKKMSALLVSYRSAVFEAEDEINAEAIESRLKEYITILEPLRDSSRLETNDIMSADESARQLVDTVERAYRFNRDRLHISAEGAGDSARHALLIAYRLGWSLGLFIICIVLVYFTYRWLAMSEENRF